MIYYNLDSQYPGDITKHCGLTIDEVDSNFYELETKINSISPSHRNPEQRFWAYSTQYTFPELNSMTVSKIDNDTAFVSGTVSYGEMMLGIDNSELYGFSPVINGEAQVNNTRIPNGMLLCYMGAMQSAFGIKARVSNYGDELKLEIGNNSVYPNTMNIITVNRRLHFTFDYDGSRIVDGFFVFDDNLLVEDYRPSVWLDISTWRNTDIWTTV